MGTSWKGSDGNDFAASLIGENIVKVEKWPSLPWRDCKVAFGVDTS
jgi:hypothetical protein